jgi:hypothetical protein
MELTRISSREKSLKLISRKDAQAEGLKRYFTGKPCKYGHVADRLISNRSCCECEVNKSNKKKNYFREWYKLNRESQLEYKRKYSASKREWRREYDREYYESHKNQCKQRTFEWRRKNKGAWYSHAAHRRALTLQRTPVWADREAIKFFYECCPAGCHVDHIIPLQGKFVSGLHVAENLQWLPDVENLRKGNKFDTGDEFLWDNL